MKKGDFVEIDFVGRIVTTGEIFDLTSEEEAKKEGIYNPKQKYRPSLVILGSGMAVPGVEKRLERMEIGQEDEFTLAPEEAFGQRNLKLVRIVSMAKFLKEKINPVPGMFVDIDGMQTKVLSVAGGRVRVDFNHPLAGKQLKYKVKVVRGITDPTEKSSLLLSYYGLKCDSKVAGDTLSIETEKPMNEFLKKFASENVLKHIPEIKNVIFSDKESKAKIEADEPKEERKHEHGSHEREEKGRKAA